MANIKSISMGELTVSQLQDRLFVHKRGLRPQIKALWFLLWHYPVAFVLGLHIAILTLSNPGKVALFIVIEALPEWREQNAEH